MTNKILSVLWLKIFKSLSFRLPVCNLWGCLYGGRKILALGRSQKAKQIFVWFTCKNFGRGGCWKSNKTVGLQQLNARLPPYLFFCPQYQDLPSEGSLYGARIFLALGSSYLSARKILVLERSQRQGQVQHFACKLNTENI